MVNVSICDTEISFFEKSFIKFAIRGVVYYEESKYCRYDKLMEGFPIREYAMRSGRRIVIGISTAIRMFFFFTASPSPENYDVSVFKT